MNSSSGNIPVTGLNDRERVLAEKLHEAQSDAVVEQAGNLGYCLAQVGEAASYFAGTYRTKVLHPESPPVACKSGCSWCCYQLVSVTAPEVFRIVDFVHNLVPEKTKEIVARLRSLDKATRGLSNEGRTKIPKSCAFLENGQCAIYDVRPLACAEFTSYDVSACKRGKRIGFKPGGLVHEKAGLVVYGAVQRGLVEGLQRAFPSADVAAIELIAGVVVALDTADAEMQWKSGSDIFKGAHLTGGGT